MGALDYSLYVHIIYGAKYIIYNAAMDKDYTP
jgi:hypothetical protein